MDEQRTKIRDDVIDGVLHGERGVDVPGLEEVGMVADLAELHEDVHDAKEVGG
jgi:hypothetical protein